MKKYSVQLLLLFSICFAIIAMVTNSKKKIQTIKLNEYLLKYELIKQHGGWHYINSTRILKIGMRFPEIKQIKKRLLATGELGGLIENVTDSFDIKLENAVMVFQKNHTLNPTGIIDKNTLRQLNVDIDYRIHQIKINIERWKNLSSDLEDYYILVNLPAGKLELIKNDTAIMQMKVIIGRFYRKTPVLETSITTIDLNPNWVIPPGIFKKDFLPKLKSNPNYLQEKDMYVTKNNKVIYHEIHWEKIDPLNNPYTITQRPGPKNPLGVIKFIFPNKHFVYMHDTPDKYLFEKDKFTFSSGCIRLSKAIELGEYILQKDQNWTRNKLDSIISLNNRFTIKLVNPLKIYLCYFTAWVNEEGVLQFAEDIYKRD